MIIVNKCLSLCNFFVAVCMMMVEISAHAMMIRRIISARILFTDNENAENMYHELEIIKMIRNAVIGLARLSSSFVFHKIDKAHTSGSH